jgi:hypothetical protein
VLDERRADRAARAVAIARDAIGRDHIVMRSST